MFLESQMNWPIKKTLNLPNQNKQRKENGKIQSNSWNYA